MIRVLHVIDHLGLGGAQSALLDILRNMDMARFDCEVAVLHGWGSFADAITRAGFRVHSLSEGRWPPSYLFRLPGCFQDRQILHFHLQGSNWLAKPLATMQTNALRIAHDHASGEIRFRGLSSLLPDAIGHFGSHRILAVSPGVRDFLVHWEAIPADRIAIIPNGVDTRQFHPADRAARQRARETLGLDSKRFVVGAMGRLAPEKNFALIPRIAARLPGAQFLIAGSGPCEAQIRAAVASEGVGEAVTLCGRVDQRELFYAALDALILPSLFEGLPMALLEAMACGLPCVASALPDIARAVGAQGADLLCPPENPEAFARALRALADAPENAASRGAAARRRSERDFSAAACAARIMDVYDEELALHDRHPLVRLPIA